MSGSSSVSKIVAKSNELSTKYRQEGRLKSPRIALKYFNLALLFAVDGSKEMAQAYRNRSYVLLLLEAYAACLQDIERALALEQLLGAATIDRLNKRKADAAQKMQELIAKGTYKPDHLKQNEPELYQGAQKDIPSFSTAIKLVHSHNKGRYLVAECDIPAGSVVMTEKPYASVLYEEFKEDYCLHCCSRLPLNHVVCKHCATEKIKFCTEECRDAAAVYHRFECARPRFTKTQRLDEDTNRHMKLAVRVLLSTPLKEAALLTDGLYGTESCPVQADDPPYKWISSLCAHESSEASNVVTSQMQPIANELVRWPEFWKGLRGVIPDCTSREAACQWLTKWLVRCRSQIKFNAKGIMKWPIVDGVMDAKLRFETFGVGLYPTFSMVCHSCVPNCFSSFINGNQIVLRTVKDISAGEELCISYGAMFGYKTKAERERYLLSNYRFKCECVACNGTDPKYIRLEKEFTAFVCQECKAAGRGVGCVPCTRPIYPIKKCLDCGLDPTDGAVEEFQMLKFTINSLWGLSRADHYDQLKLHYHPHNDWASRMYESYEKHLLRLNRPNEAARVIIESNLPYWKAVFGDRSWAVAGEYERVKEHYTAAGNKKLAHKYRQMADEIYAIYYGSFK